MALRFALTVLALMTAAVLPVNAAEMRRLYRDANRPEMGSLHVAVDGDLRPGDADRLTALIAEIKASGRVVRGIDLDSPGGSLAEGFALAAYIRQNKLVAVVIPGGRCASACFLAFAAGQGKIIGPGARVGVHGASIGGRETPEAARATILMAREAARLGVPPAILGQMAITPPDRIVWLSREDLASMAGEFGKVLFK